MSLKASEISELIKERIKRYEAAAEARNIGTITLLTDGIVRIHGLADARYGEMLEFPGDTFGLALNLEQDSVGAVVLGDYEHLSEGDTVKTTGRILEVPVGEALLGRVVDSLGRPVDGKGPIATTATSPIEKVAPGVITRKSVSQPVQTGLKSIDAMVPIGRGQRELIIGDRQTGKTAVAIDAIINQKGQGVYCFYVAIGQKQSTVAQVVEKLKHHGAMDYTIIVAANASDPAPLQFLAPYSGVTTATLTITGATAGLSGNQYRVVGTNSAGTATSNAATLTVNTAPTITTQPTSQTVNAGQNVTFVVGANGTPTPTYQWQLSSGGGPFTNLTNAAPYSGVTTATLTITGAAAGLSGNQYRALVTNGVAPDATSAAATLTVNVAPAITTQPANQTVNAGQTAAFSVVATGTPAPTYQWQVSSGGGEQAAWRGDGKALYYVNANRMLVEVDIKSSVPFVLGSQRHLFQLPIPGVTLTGPRTYFAATRDGQRFLVNALAGHEGTRDFQVVLNWDAPLRAK